MFLTRGLALLLHDSLPITHGLDKLSGLALNFGNLSIPCPALVLFLVFLVCAATAGYTKLGRCVYALGGNENSALLMGLPVAGAKITVYGLSGLCSALGGVVYSLYTQSGNPNGGLGLEVDAIAAVVIGGTLLTGGVGSMFGTLLGVLILGIIQTAISFQGKLSAPGGLASSSAASSSLSFFSNDWCKAGKPGQRQEAEIGIDNNSPIGRLESALAAKNKSPSEHPGPEYARPTPTLAGAVRN